MQMLCRIFFAYLILGCTAAAAQHTESAVQGVTRIFLSPDGDDRGDIDPGSSQIGPLASWARVDEAITAVGKLRPGREQILVDVAPGYYTMSKPLVLSVEKLGGTRLRIQGAGAAVTKVSGARSLAVSADKVETVSVSAADIRQFLAAPYGAQTGVAEHPFLIWKDDQRIVLGRWPAAGWGYVGRAELANGVWHLALASFSGSSPQQSGDVRISGFLGNDWDFESLPAVMDASGDIAVRASFVHYGVHVGARVFLEALPELKGRAEVVLNRDDQTLQFVKSGNYEWARVPSFAEIKSNSANISIKGITFSGFSGDALKLGSVNDVDISENSFTKIGGRGILVADGSNVRILNNEFDRLGQGGVDVTGGDRISLRVSNIVVAHNSFSNFAELTLAYRPAVKLAGVGITVENNVMRNGPSMALLFEGNDHHIIGNVISAVNRQCGDCGAIYAWGDLTTYGTSIVGNLFYDIKPHVPMPAIMRLRLAETTKGIYLDNLVSGITVSRNVFYDVDYPIFANAGSDLVFEQNCFIKSSPPLYFRQYGALLPESKLTSSNWVMKNLNYLRERNSALFDRYPRLLEPIASLKNPRGNKWGGNVLVNSSSPMLYEGGRQFIELMQDDVVIAPETGIARSTEEFMRTGLHRWLGGIDATASSVALCLRIGINDAK